MVENNDLATLALVDGMSNLLEVTGAVDDFVDSVLLSVELVTDWILNGESLTVESAFDVINIGGVVVFWAGTPNRELEPACVDGDPNGDLFGVVVD